MIVLGIIILIIFLICMIPVGVDFNFENDKLCVSARASALRIKLFPKSKKDSTEKENIKKPPKEKKEKKKKKKPKKEKSGPGLIISKEDIVFLVKKVLYKIGRFCRSFNVDRFMLHYIAAGNDPYNVARDFAYVNAALSSLAPLCERRFNCKDVDVWTDCDFDYFMPLIEIGFSIYLRIGALFVLIFGILNSAIAMLVRNKCRLLYFKLFDKEAYEEEYEESQKIPRLLAKLNRGKAALTGELNKLKSTFVNKERTNENYV